MSYGPKNTVGTLGPHTVFPIAISCPFVFSWLPSTVVWNFSKVILVLGKVVSLRVPNLNCSVVESCGWFDITQKTALDMMHEQAHYCDEAANHQMPTAAAFWIIWIVFMEECSDLLQNLMQISCSTHSSHFEWDCHTVHIFLCTDVAVKLFCKSYNKIIINWWLIQELWFWSPTLGP